MISEMPSALVATHLTKNSFKGIIESWLIAQDSTPIGRGYLIGIVRSDCL